MAEVQGESGGGVSHRENVLLSNQYNGFNALLSSIEAYLLDTPNSIRLKVADTQLAEITAEKVTWDANYLKYLDPATHNRAVILETERLYKITYATISGLQQQVKNNAEVELIGDDYTQLGIHLDKTTRTPTPVETVAPNIVMVKASRLSNEFYTTYPDPEGNAHRRLPHRNNLLIKVAHVASSAEPPPAENDYDEVYQSGRSTFTLVAPIDTPLGTIGYVKACYSTFTGKMGPSSEAFQFVIN
ncbi:MAG: hypothetical protein HAW58_00065 [Candidatus Thioglobus sp.]|nr:hypothetical protein [Candidatus Thioglobus sp.]